METIRRAVIDVGTNSIKLLVADVNAHLVAPVWEGSKQTRLGHGFYQTHRLQPESIAQTANAVAEFADAARQHGSKAVRVIATSAVRDALNSVDLIKAIKQCSALDVEILTGEQEAELAFHGVITEPSLANLHLLILDAGGGSTEFILGHGQHKDFSGSFPLGSVRLMETIPHSDPPRANELYACREWVGQFLRGQVIPGLLPAMRKVVASGDSVHLVGTGGAAAILARIEAQMCDYDRDRIEAVRLSRNRVHWHVQYLWELPLEKRKKIVGLPSNRADVILAGAVIYEVVMEVFEFAELRISTRGLRFAALME